eukprot:763290-Hanusia_phi.AAC.1
MQSFLFSPPGSRGTTYGASRARCSSVTRRRSAVICSSAGQPQRKLEDCERLLEAFDRDQQQAAREGGEGFGGGTSALRYVGYAALLCVLLMRCRWAQEYEDREGLRHAVLSLGGASERIMMGFCANSAQEGVGALQAWVSALRLPRGRLHGMDKDGVPLDMSSFGAVYIKYSSTGGEILSAGDATLNGYDGSYRGVYFNPTLPDGKFRQYAVLPLDLFSDKREGVDLFSEQKDAQSTLSKESIQSALQGLRPVLQNLNAKVEVVSVEEGKKEVQLRLTGPAHLRFGVLEFLQGTLPGDVEAKFVDD